MARSLSPNELFPAGRSDITSRTLSLRSGVRVRIAESGVADGDPVVCLHGWGACLYAFRDALSLLPPRGFRVIALDMRGYGLSDHPRSRGSYTLERYISDLISLLDELALERVNLVGHSMGGGIALRFALEDPRRVRALALINPTSLVPIPIVRWAELAPRFAVNLADGRVPRWLVRQVLHHLAFSDTRRLTARDVDEYWAPTRVDGYVYAVRAAIGEFDWRPLTDAQKKTLAVPAVVILGEQDRLIRDAAPAAEGLRAARVVGLRGGHCVHEEQPETVYPLIADFFRR